MTSEAELGIPEKMQLLHRALRSADLDHAFGGALALAWCVGEVRATMDIDINIFAGIEELDAVLTALPGAVTSGEREHEALLRDGQARLHWGRHPVDVFLNTTDFHREAAQRIRWEPLLEDELPFLSCGDLVVFKAFFSRGKDWVDLEAMHAAGSFDVAKAVGVLADYLGLDDERVARLQALGGH